VIAACVGAAVAPDLDILVHHHRSYTHSVGAAIVVGLFAWLVARNWRVALTIAVAYSTHILLDWLGQDTAPPFGVLALWPFSSQYYISGADLFAGVSRRYWKPDEFIVGNLKAVGLEILVLAPIAMLAWYVHSYHGGRRENTKRTNC
jgi:inner membrane protein